MKIYHKTIFATIITILVVACKGQDGAVGPIGATGLTGATGTSGATGAAGANANVVYSEWKSVSTDVSSEIKDSKGNYTTIVFTPLDKREPLFTKDAIDKAAIYTYIKYRPLTNDNGVYSLPERIKLGPELNDVVGSFFLIPGRSAVSFVNTQIFYMSNSVYGENYFNYLIGIYPVVQTNTSYTLIPEFVGKDLKYFQGVVAANMQIRHVVVYGIVKGGRSANIDWNDYEAVKTALNLKD